MDFLDPKKQKRNKIQLAIGYVLIAITVGLTTLVLIFVAEGYGFGKNGQIIQNGFVFVSSTPNPAKIYLNGKYDQTTTNARLQLPAGQYTLKLVRAGYRPWVRPIGVDGGVTEHFDYPFLVPSNLVTTNVMKFSRQPSLLTQSPSRQWLIVSDPKNVNSFFAYDLSNPKQPVSSIITLPAGVLTKQGQNQSWKLVDWSTDNQHILLQHNTSAGSEYIVLNINTPSQSFNLSKRLGLALGTDVTFFNEKYDQYYLYDTKTNVLSTASLSDIRPVAVLSGVLAFNAYGDNVILYATTQNAPAGYVNFDIWESGQNYVVQKEKTGKNYLVNITQYQGDWYAALGNGSDGKIYIYKDPVAQLQNKNLPLVPVYIMRIDSPTFLKFSANAQFIAAEGADQFSVYDIFNENGYTYKLNLPLAANETASWMDGDRLTLISGGKVKMFDYDDANQQTLQPALVGYGPYYDQAYKWSYTLAPTSSKVTPYALTSTALRIPADQ